MSELFGIKIPQDPWVVVPCIVLATAFCAYLVNVIVPSLVRPVVQKTYTHVDNRICRLLERFLFPLLILGGLLVIEDAVPLPPKGLRAAHSVFIVCALLFVICNGWFGRSRTVGQSDGRTTGIQVRFS